MSRALIRLRSDGIHEIVRPLPARRFAVALGALLVVCALGLAGAAALFVFHGTFLKLYLARLLYAIRAVFELYPHVQGFRLIVDDVERGISLSRVFGREDYEEKIALIGKNLFKENWEDTYLYQSLAQV